MRRADHTGRGGSLPGSLPVVPSPRMSHRIRSWFVVGMLATLAGCADDVAPVDGGPDGSVDGGGDAGLPVTPPDIPWLSDGLPPVMLAPCPEGWREVTGGEVTECDPYPEGGPEACAEGEAHFPGEPGCRPIGDPCPAGDYATTLPTTGRVVYVKADAAAGGDGTVAAPFAGLSQVPWVSLGASTTVAVGKGTYPGTLPLRVGVSVVGACVEETILTGIAAPVQSVVSVTGAGEPAEVQNLTIRGASQRGALARRGQRLSLRGVLFDRVQGVGIVVADASTEVSLTDVVIRDTEAVASSPSEFGIGIHVQDGGQLQATRFLVLRNGGLGISAAGEGSALTLLDTVVRETRPRDSDGIAGRGINAEAGARVDATRMLLVGNRLAGAICSGVGTTVTLTDSVVRDTDSRARDGIGGGGVSAELGGTISLTRLLIASNRAVGVFVSNEGTEAVLTDVVIRDTEPQRSRAPGGRGRGIQLQYGAHLEATRLVISNNTESGIFVGSEGSTMSVTDAVIQRTLPLGLPGQFGRGLGVENDGRLDASRLLIADNHELGFFASSPGTVVNLSDVVIRDTRSQLNDLRGGRGFEVQEGARVDGMRLEIERSVEAGVLALTGASVALTDASIVGVAVADCASTTCPTDPYGHAVGALGAALSLRRFRISDAAVCGAMVGRVEEFAEDGSLDLEAGVVSEAEIGACVQVDGYDLERLTGDVEFRENATNLDSTTLPVPNVSATVGL